MISILIFHDYMHTSFDTLQVFPKDFFEKVNLKKRRRQTIMQNYPARKELIGVEEVMRLNGLLK